ncbi:MAG: hypothetical protein SF123_20435 [Chloroflexota bacterium]|nr:hypothetical protein [Chloroflexota bacterium]
MDDLKTRFIVGLCVTMLCLVAAGVSFAANEYVVTSIPAGQCSGDRIDTVQTINVTSQLYGSYTISSAGFSSTNTYTGAPFTGIGILVDYIATTPFTFPANTLITITDTWFSDVGRTSLVGQMTVTFDCTTGAIVSGGGAAAPLLFADGRVNQQQWASASAYCRTDGIEVWSIGADGRGQLAFTVTREDVEAMETMPEVNTLLAEAEGPRGTISLWRLTSGEFQLMSPGEGSDSTKLYIFIWSGCPQWR